MKIIRLKILTIKFKYFELQFIKVCTDFKHVGYTYTVKQYKNNNAIDTFRKIIIVHNFIK